FRSKSQLTTRNRVSERDRFLWDAAPDLVSSGPGQIGRTDTELAKKFVAYSLVPSRLTASPRTGPWPALTWPVTANVVVSTTEIVSQSGKCETNSREPSGVAASPYGPVSTGIVCVITAGWSNTLMEIWVASMTETVAEK